jgi:hypothetical protein
MTAMRRCQRGVHFGAVGLKRAEESSKFPTAIFFNNFVILWQLKTKIIFDINNFRLE